MIRKFKQLTALAGLLALLAGAGMPAHAAATFKVTKTGVATITLTSAQEILELSPGEGKNQISYLYQVNMQPTYGTLDGVTGNLTIDAKGGDNYVKISDDLTLPKNLTIKSGSGNDTFDLFDCLIINDLKLLPNSGNDTINIDFCTVNDDAQIKTSGGDDDVYISNTTVDDILNVNTGNGNDKFVIDEGAASLPNWFGGNTSITTGAGNDLVLLSNAFFIGRTRVSMGGGADTLELEFDQFYGPATFNTGAGNDKVDVSGAFFGARAEFNGSAGNDDVYLENVENTIFDSVVINKGFEVISEPAYPCLEEDQCCSEENELCQL